MANIFISYANSDEKFARSLSNKLEENGNNVFFAGGSIPAGQDWQASIANSLKDADAMIIILSEEASNSKWIMHEAGAAVGFWQEKGKPVVLPLVIDDIQIPGPLSHIQAIFALDRNLDKIAGNISRALDAALGRIKAREDEKREAQAHVEATAESYISESLEELRARESGLKKSAYVWYSAAFFSLLMGLGFGLWRAFTSAPNADITWQSIAQLAVVSIIVIGLLGALSRFAFILGKSFMVESLRNSDRIHAISFGQFYLKAFGEHAEWSEIKEAFQHWNIDKGSSFMQQEAKDIDPEILKTALEIAKSMTTKNKSK